MHEVNRSNEQEKKIMFGNLSKENQPIGQKILSIQCKWFSFFLSRRLYFTNRIPCFKRTPKEVGSPSFNSESRWYAKKAILQLVCWIYCTNFNLQFYVIFFTFYQKMFKSISRPWKRILKAKLSHAYFVFSSVKLLNIALRNPLKE